MDIEWVELLHLESLVDCLLDDPHGEVAGDAADVHLLGEGRASRQIVSAVQTSKKLARSTTKKWEVAAKRNALALIPDQLNESLG